MVRSPPAPLRRISSVFRWAVFIHQVPIAGGGQRDDDRAHAVVPDQGEIARTEQAILHAFAVTDVTAVRLHSGANAHPSRPRSTPVR